VWQASTKQASGGNTDTGALARLHPHHRFNINKEICKCSSLLLCNSL
jgi:hypothetical protein